MNARRWSLLGCVAVAALVASASSYGVELAAEHKEKLVALDQSLQKVVTLYRDKKTDEMKKLIEEIESGINGLQIANENDGSIGPVLEPFRQRLDAAKKLSEHAAMLATASPVKTPTPGANPAMTTPMPGMPTPSGTMPRPLASGTRPRPGQMPAGAVSFTKDVAPILVAKCEGCHIRGNRGDFSMANFNALAAGTGGTLAVIKPGQGETSIFYEKMSSGEMPPGNNKVSDMELAVIKKWIDEGARYDYPDRMASLLTFAPGMGGGQGGQIARATGNEKVQFMRDIAPILVDNCFDCHGAPNPNDNSDNFGMNKFADLMRGGQSGPVVRAGNPDGSTLIQMLRGTAKGANNEIRPRMPRGGQLTDEDIGKFVTWIAEGAKFDGEDPQMAIDLAVRMAIAKKATHEELMAQRMATAKRNWQMANPDSPAESLETTDFFIIGDIGMVRLEEVKATLEAEKAKIVQSMKLQAGKPLVKGRITVYVFNKGFEHKEFAQVVERRQLSDGILGHWSFNYIDAYACVTASAGLAEEIAPLLDETVLGCYFDSTVDRLPRWFAVGTARNMAAKMHPQSPVTKGWEDSLAAAPAGLTPQSLMGARNLDAGMSAISQAFVKDLMKSPQWTSLMGNLGKGANFDGAFAQAFRGQPQQILTQWLSRR